MAALNELTEEELQLMERMTPGDFGIYRIRNERPAAVFLSSGLSRATGWTDEEFLRDTGEDATLAAAESDRPFLLKAIADCIERGTADFLYRLRIRSGGFLWVRGRAKRIGVMQGDPVLLICYAADTSSNNLFQVIVNHSGRDIFILDVHTHEMLYANQQLPDADSRLGCCYKVIRSRGNACDTCLLDRTAADHSIFEKFHDEKKQRWYRLSAQRITWCGHDACLIYQDDITARREEVDRYRNALRQLEAQYPTYLASFHLNLTRNLCDSGKGPEDFMNRALKAGTADAYIEAFSEMIADEEIRGSYRRLMDRGSLIREYENGNTSVSMEYPIVTANGERHWRNGLLYMLKNPLTGDIEAMSYAVDIDSQKKREQISRRITEENFDFIALIHPQSATIEYWQKNDTLSFIELGRPMNYQEAFHLACTRMISEEDQQRFEESTSLAHILAALQESGSWSSSFRCVRSGKPSHRRQEFSWLEKPGYDILMVQRDISAEYEQEQEWLRQKDEALLAAQQAIEAKSTFFSSMSHDLRTPLNGIVGFTELALKDQDLHTIHDYLEKIQVSAALLTDIVNDSLELSRFESGKMKLEPEACMSQEPLEAVVTALGPAAAAKHLKIDLDLARVPASSRVWIDKLKAQKILLNLLSNAIKYTPEYGTIRMSADVLAEPVHGCNRRFVMEDTGIGMTPEFMERMYDPFAQENRPEARSTSGTGLGLAIVKRNVELMGGTIEVESTVGKGTRFTVYLPFPPVPQTDAQQIQPAQDVPAENLSGRSVLLCEDNYLNAEIATLVLKERGVHVDTAANGRIGLDTFLHAPANTYAAILMDIRMPVMNGLDAARAIRSLDRPDAREIPIIAMTANAYEEDVHECMAAGMNAHIAKPIDTRLMIETLERCIRERED